MTDKATTKRRSAAELIAFHFGSDIADIRDAIYQPTRIANPSVYTLGDHYYCAMRAGRPVPAKSCAAAEWRWKEAGHYYGWIVYKSEA